MKIKRFNDLLDSEKQDLLESMRVENHFLNPHLVFESSPGKFAGCCQFFMAMFAWIKIKDANPIATIRIIDFLENSERAQGRHVLIVPVSEESPLKETLEKRGYKSTGNFNLMEKEL